MKIDKTEYLIFGVMTLLLIIFIMALAIFSFTAPKEQGFTELYFTGELPKEVRAGYEYSFSFIIHNYESKRVEYQYYTYFGTIKISEGNATLEHGDELIINQNFIPGSFYRGEKIPLNVRLLNNDQEIYFWVDVK